MTRNLTTYKRFTRILACFLSMTAAAGVSGCGQTSGFGTARSYPVKGKVLLPDGKPLTSGNVVFVATKSTVSSLGKVENDGSFVLNGLPDGDYKVRLEASETTHAKKGSPPFPSKYLDEDGSDLAATVKPDETANNFEFKLTSSSPQNSSRRGTR